MTSAPHRSVSRGDGLARLLARGRTAVTPAAAAAPSAARAAASRPRAAGPAGVGGAAELLALLSRRAQAWAWQCAHHRRADVFSRRFGHVYLPPRRMAPPRVHRPWRSRPRRRPGAEVGFSSRNVFNLGDFLDEVDKEAMALHADAKRWLQQGGGHDWLPHGFFAEWHRFMDASPYGFDETTGRPYGWRDYYAKHRSLVDRMSDNLALVWAETEAFEDEVADFHRRARDKSAEPSAPPPEPGHQPPPPLWEQPEAAPVFDKVESALEWLAIIGTLVGAGYVLHGLGQLKR